MTKPDLRGVICPDYGVLGEYVYAYIESGNRVQYIGKGTGARCAEDHPLAGEFDCVILGSRLDSPVQSVSHALYLESILTGLYGRKQQTEFEKRMRLPSVLDNKIAKSTTSLEIRGLPTSLVNFATLSRRDAQFLGPADFDFTKDVYVRVPLAGSFDLRANLDQLKAITCEWWNLSIPAPQGTGLVFLGWNSAALAWHRQTVSVPLIVSAFRIDRTNGPVVPQAPGRSSWTAAASYDHDLWSRLVGHALPSHTNLQGAQRFSEDSKILAGFDDAESKMLTSDQKGPPMPVRPGMPLPRLR